MKKHIKSFVSPILRVNEEEEMASKSGVLGSQSQLFVEPEEAMEIRSRNKEIVKSSVGKNLEKYLNDYWTSAKEMETMVISLKNQIEENYNKMFENIKNAIQELEKHGIEIENQIEFENNIVMKVSEKQKMHHLSDGDKVKLFNYLQELDEKKAETLKAFARSTNMINEYYEYVEMGLFYKKASGSERAREPYFRKMEILPEVSEGLDFGSKLQSIISSVMSFLKNAWSGMTKYGKFFGLENSIKDYKKTLIETEKFVESL
jgi:hypothetical protein